jgi:hypothetical protein
MKRKIGKTFCYSPVRLLIFGVSRLARHRRLLEPEVLGHSSDEEMDVKQEIKDEPDDEEEEAEMRRHMRQMEEEESSEEELDEDVRL